MEKLEKLQQHIVEIFAEQFATQLPSEETDLLETGLVDSIKIIELVLELEQDGAVLGVADIALRLMNMHGFHRHHVLAL